MQNKNQILLTINQKDNKIVQHDSVFEDAMDLLVFEIKPLSY